MTLPARRLASRAAVVAVAFAAWGCGGTSGGGGSPDGSLDGTVGDGHHDGTAADGGHHGDGGIGDGHGGGDGSGSKDGSGESGGGILDGGIFGGEGGACLKLGGGCKSPSECCSDVCTGGVCDFPACTSDGMTCASDGECCSGSCGSSGTCTPLNTSCETLGNACAGSGDCCSGLCKGGVCSPSSFCTQNGDICATGADCCGGVCNVPGGSSVGTCSQPPGHAANCTAVDGTLCAGLSADGGVVIDDAGLPSCGGSCCSRLCAPYGPTGVLVCQPASGCHVVGDVCRKDSDCCGSTGLPGEPKKPVTCDITPPNTLGVCRNPIGCKPNGDVCKLATMSCNASCDCCSGNCETMDTCKPDTDGVPRCAGVTCVDAGASCASSADCCNGLPCVPDPSFVDGGTGAPFVCGTTTCVGACGLCTTNADCCPGTSCNLPLGSSVGFCGPCGSKMDGGTGGKDGGGSKDGGGGDAPMCSLYGQECTKSSDCCNGVPCTSGVNAACTAGETGCTCHYPG